ncbi:MAG TPA: hypothetical protein VK651_06275 [Blastocatellia bacterium]|nr:hypothetical protein [Blastocatellia bacterium]
MSDKLQFVDTENYDKLKFVGQAMVFRCSVQSHNPIEIVKATVCGIEALTATAAAAITK